MISKQYQLDSFYRQNPRKTANKRFLSNMLVSTLRNPLQRNSCTAGSEREKHDRHIDSDRLESHRNRKHSQGGRKDSTSESDTKNHQSLQDFERSQKTERHEKTRENFYHRGKHSSESPEYLHKGKELGRQNERKNGSMRHSSDRKSYHDAVKRNYPKVRKGDERYRDNKESWLSREGPPSDLSDVYHKDYMEYIQNYEKHMNYFEKMEEKELQQKHSRSYLSEERKTCLYETKEKRHSSESKMHQKSKKSKKKRRKIASESDDNPSSDFPEFGVKCHQKDNSILQSKEKSRNKRKKYNEKRHKSAKKKMKTAKKIVDSSPKEDVNVGEKLESDSSVPVECDEGLKGDYSDLSNFTGTFSKGKKSKHKKHKDKKRKKYTEEKICTHVT